MYSNAATRAVEKLPQSAELENGETAARVGCAICPNSVNLVTAAETGDVLDAFGQAGVGFSVVSTNEAGNGVGWNRSASADCDPSECPNSDLITEMTARIEGLAS